jgi:hypothetical protein
MRDCRVATSAVYWSTEFACDLVHSIFDSSKFGDSGECHRCAQGGGLAGEQITSSGIDDETNSIVSFSEERFKRLCKSLRRNDPKVTNISTWGDSLERHSCHTLGKALTNNTVVTTIKIELDYILSKYDNDINLDRFEPLITVLRTSPSLTVASLKRKHWPTDVEHHRLSNTLAETILQAFAANPHCKVKLDFDVAECHFELASVLKVARSIVSLRIELDHFRKGKLPRLMADDLGGANQSYMFLF